MPIVICITCGAKRERRPSHIKRVGRERMTCSRACRGKRVTRVCAQCETAFLITPSEIADGRGTFCSAGCYQASVRARTLSRSSGLPDNQIGLTRGMVAIVDPSLRPYLLEHTWCATKGRHTWYATALINGRYVGMHRLVLGVGDGYVVDHENGNGLDNRASNLRRATHRQNKINGPGSRKSGTPYKGVYFCKFTGRYAARLRNQGCEYFLGRYDTAGLAARAYDVAAQEYFGEFAWTNFPLVDLASPESWRIL